MENDKHCLRLLKMSYNHLPVYLKPCFLYMGVFEEDDVIRVSTLIKHWVSEGFLNPKNGEALEKTARRFLQDLVDGNLILIGELGSTGSIKSCKIHDLLRDLCLKEGQKEGLYHVIGKSNPSQSMNTQRLVVIPKNTSKKKARDDLKSIPYVRSVIWECGEYPPFGNLGFLRKLHSNRFGYFGNKMYMNSLAFRYINLQHLAIEAHGMLSFLPAVSLLWNLHTLIVSCPNDDPTLLADFWKMPQFRNIQFVDCSFCLPGPPSDGRDGDAVVIMENMHTLKGLRNFKCCEGVVKRIPNVKKLKLKYDDILGANYLQDEHFVGNIKSLCTLESLSFSLGLVCESFGAFVNSKLTLTFPQSLKKLSLNSEYYHFKWEDTLEMIGSLPLLEKLELRGGCFGEGKWETVEGQFPCLKYLKLQYCKGLENWTAAEEGTIFPRLEYLYIFALKQLKNIPSELGNIDTLKSIHLIGCEGVVKSAKEMVVEQVELQGEEQLSFHVVADLWGENKHLQNLAGPNFQVI